MFKPDSPHILYHFQELRKGVSGQSTEYKPSKAGHPKMQLVDYQLPKLTTILQMGVLTRCKQHLPIVKSIAAHLNLPTKLDCYICHPCSLEIHLFIQKPAATDILPILKDTTWVPHPENHLTCFALL
jgi:hypothetical protein